jgi:hypothetical protein
MMTTTTAKSADPNYMLSCSSKLILIFCKHCLIDVHVENYRNDQDRHPLLHGKTTPVHAFPDPILRLNSRSLRQSEETQ